MQPGTGYTAPNLKPIHPHDLMILDWYISFLSGKATLPNGGIVMAATSQSNAPQIPALDLALGQLEGDRTTRAGQLVAKRERTPLMRYDERVLDALIGGRSGRVGVQRLEGLSKEETRGLIEYWARSGMVRERVSEGFVGEKWASDGHTPKAIGHRVAPEKNTASHANASAWLPNRKDKKATPRGVVSAKKYPLVSDFRDRKTLMAGGV
ncbi:MAG: hypothetical protein L6R39_005280 [Caloplaca ligustica]|nr:MAG: hypothetical protein L6R39_005280 [Caloplaca ligustica]